MQNKFGELLTLTKETMGQSISMKRKLLLYWVVMALVVFALFLVVLSFAGVFSNPARKLNQDLEAKLSNTYASMADHFDTLAARCIQLSEEASTQIEAALGYGVSIQTLNDQPDRLLELQRSLYVTIILLQKRMHRLCPKTLKRLGSARSLQKKTPTAELNMRTV